MAGSDRSAAIPTPSSGPDEGSKPGRPNIHVMDLVTITTREQARYPTGSRGISLPSGQGVSPKGAERRASIG